MLQMRLQSLGADEHHKAVTSSIVYAAPFATEAAPSGSFDLQHLEGLLHLGSGSEGTGLDPATSALSPEKEPVLSALYSSAETLRGDRFSLFRMIRHVLCRKGQDLAYVRLDTAPTAEELAQWVSKPWPPLSEDTQKLFEKSVLVHIKAAVMEEQALRDKLVHQDVQDVLQQWRDGKASGITEETVKQVHCK